jgi:hypothetical protein
MTEEIVPRTQMNVVKTGFSENTMMQQDNIAAVLAARAKAETEARYIIAMKFPRDWNDVRRKMLESIERPGFAGLDRQRGDGSQAWYKKPIGKGVEGFSIRFAEEALRAMGNMDARSTIIWEDDIKRLIQVEVNDLENNISIPTVIVIEKTVERKALKPGEVALSQRVNSYGETVYLRAATEDEILQKQNSAISKAMRNGILRLLPGDIQAECKARILAIRFGDTAKDPKAFVRKVADGFAKHGIKPSDLKKHIGHEIESCSNAELYDLRKIWQAIEDGEITWADVVSESSQKSKLDALTARIQQSNEEKPEAEQPELEHEPIESEQPVSHNTEITLDEQIETLAKELWKESWKNALYLSCENQNINPEDMNDEEKQHMIGIMRDLKAQQVRK